MSDQSVLLIATALTSIVTLVVSLYKDARDRKWRKEDEEQKRLLGIELLKQQKQDAEEKRILAAELLEQQKKDAEERRIKEEKDEAEREAIRQFRHELRGRHEVLNSALHYNTAISEKAFTEANDVNTKILDVNNKILDVNKDLLDVRQTVQTIAERPAVPVVAIRAEDAKALLSKRENPLPPTRRKEDTDNRQ